MIFLLLKIEITCSRGYGVCLVEYRRVGHEGGGWPGTNDDIANAMKKLEDVLQNEKEISSAEHSDSDSTQQKVILLGHSAGGTLALWIACKSSMLGDIVPITLCVAVAPIGNLEEGSRRRLSDDGDAIDLYMGCVPIGTSNLGTEICPYRYHQISDVIHV
jgi:alpha-beta hydrolase superfamily lysophospholipase